jgi:hypothetical protein
MSSSSANDLRTALQDAGTAVQPDESLLRPVRTLSFWVAIALPFLYLPLLATGLENTTVTTAFIALLVLNAVTLFVGHPHRRE